MSPIDTSGIKSGIGVSVGRSDTEVHGDTTNEAGTSAKAAPSDSVQLTDTASRLAELQAKVTEMEGVDFERVQEIREQIADGTYSIDAGRVANALLTMEKELL